MLTLSKIQHNSPATTVAVMVLCVFSVGAKAGNRTIAAPDAREVYTKNSPGWLRAVGKLQVPGQRVQAGQRQHHLEDCSATLVSSRTNARVDTIITAWHCLEYYKDLSKRITFTLVTDSPEPFTSEVYRLADGGSMEADWAIMRLYQPVPVEHAYPLKVHPGRADKGTSIVMAGFSSDDNLGQYGQLLTYDPQCRITLQASSTSDSDCRALKGSSGGAVVQISESGEARLSGVISQGNGLGVSTFTPVAGFRSAISRHLR
jgi:hypothetical protein